MLNEVASTRGSHSGTHAHARGCPDRARSAAPSATEVTRQAPSPWADEAPEPRDIAGLGGVAEPAGEVEPDSFEEDETQFGVQTEHASPHRPPGGTCVVCGRTPIGANRNPTATGHRPPRAPARRTCGRGSGPRPSPLAVRRNHRRADAARTAHRQAGHADGAALSPQPSPGRPRRCHATTTRHQRRRRSQWPRRLRPPPR